MSECLVQSVIKLEHSEKGKRTFGLGETIAIEVLRLVDSLISAPRNSMRRKLIVLIN